MDKGTVIVTALIVLLIVGIAYSIYALVGMYSNTYTIKGTVVKTWIDPVEGGSAYLVKIRLEDGSLKMLEVKTNGYFFAGVNEDIVFTSIETNKTYNFKCWGWDIETIWIWKMYWYPNVIAVTEVV
jgi:hypothetical protein